ncbi:hypothetical protein Ahia01_000680200 [Argonauta hians]
MAEKPELPYGYLGAQEKFGEFGLSTQNYAEPEITIQDNELEIKLKASKPVKVTCNLIACKDDAETPEYVFTHTLDQIVTLVIHFPASGFYKLQIYALPLSDESKTLPGVFNYLVHVKRALNAAYAFPKQYAQWKDGCYLYEPLVLHSGSSLAKVNFKCRIPKANAVAVVAEGEWVHLTKDANENWEGKVPLTQHRGKGVKVTLNANFGPDETKYSTLLEYHV